jgi:1-phosphofructokinase
MILTVTLNPSVDRAIYLTQLKLGDTNRIERTETDAGGKGINLSRVADELGARTLATGLLGGGPGAFIRGVLAREGVPHDFVPIRGETRLNISVEDSSEDPPTTFNERGPEISGPEWAALLAKCEELAPGVRWACLGGSVPPGLPADAYRTLGNLFKKSGARLLLDADGEPMRLGLESGPDLVKPNANEAERLLGYPVASDGDAVRAASDLRSRGIPTVLISRGRDGAVLQIGSEGWIGRSPQVEAKSSIGSGDSMLGGFLWALEEGLPPAECLRWGLAAGAATATTTGAEIGRQPVIERLLPHADVLPATIT